MIVCCGAISLLPPSGLSPSSGLEDSCMLWDNLVAVSEWVVSIFEVRGQLYVTDVIIALERYMVRRIK